MDMEDENEKLPDQKAVIMNLMDFAKCDFGFTIGEEDIDDDDFPYPGEDDPE